MKSEDIISISQSCKNYLEQKLEERKKWKVFWLRSCCKIKNLQISKVNSVSPLRARLCAPPAPPAADWELRAWEVERWRGGEVERWAQRQRHLIVLTITNQLRCVGLSWTGSTNVIPTSWQSQSSWEVVGPVLDYKLQTSHRTSAPTSSWQLASQEASSNHQLQVIYASWQIENGHVSICLQRALKRRMF